MKKFVAALFASLLLVAAVAPAAEARRGGGPDPCAKNAICLPSPVVM